MNFKTLLMVCLPMAFISQVAWSQDASRSNSPDTQFYVEPVLFTGSLTLVASNTEFATRPQIQNVWLEPASKVLWIAAESNSQTMSRAVWQALEKQSCRVRFLDLSDESSALLPPNPARRTFEQLIVQLGSLDSQWTIVLDRLPAYVCSSPKMIAELGKALGKHLNSAGHVVLLQPNVSASGSSVASNSSSSLIASLGLVSDLDIRCSSESNRDRQMSRLVLHLAEDSIARVRGRELRSLLDSGETYLALPATSSYPQISKATCRVGATIDLTAWRRAQEERKLRAFPETARQQPAVKNGSLVIVGGGGATNEIWNEFITRSGGPNSKIIVLPTAVPDPSLESGEARILRRLGVRNVVVLPQKRREEVTDPDFLREFETAGGVWFGGGRQWHFVDAYWGTPAWNAILSVVQRGGVIGGSSAGATIQGDLLVRGHPLGNHIMIADGYRRGLGLLPNVAIDQHFKQRNRFQDLAGCLAPYPNILGIGIDESTALVVEAPDKCQVIGSGSVWVLPMVESPEASRKFVEHATGTEFDLRSYSPQK